MARKAGSQTFFKRERVNFPLSTGTSGDFASWQISPTDSQLFPELSTPATCYTRYKFNSLAIQWIPRVSTDLSATVMMAWTPTAIDDDGDYHDDRKLAALPVTAQGAARQPFSMTIPTTFLKDIKRLKPETEDYEKNNYTSGQLFAYGYGEEKDDVGDLFITYSITLMERRISDISSADAINVLTQTAAEPFSLIRLRALSGEDRIWSSAGGMNMRVIYWASCPYGQTMDISVALDNGEGFEAVTADWKRTEGEHVVASYTFAADPTTFLRFDHDNNATTAKALVINASRRVAAFK